MPQLAQQTIVTADTTNGVKASYDVRNLTAISLYASAVGGTSADVQVEATADPAGAGGWAAVAMRQQGGSSYATTAVTISAGGGKSLFLDPTDNINWIRVNVTNQNGPTALTVVLTGEQ